MRATAKTSTRLARAIATFGFTGYLPVAPGTWASAVTAILWLLLPPIHSGAARILIPLPLWIFLLGLGTWSAHRMESHLGHDDGRVVIDEVAGFLLTVAGFEPSLRLAVAGFLLFRFLDIVKPTPIYQIQALPGGIGVMADDILAGAIGNLILRALVALVPGLLVGAG